MADKDLSELFIDLTDKVEKLTKIAQKSNILKFKTEYFWIDIFKEFHYDKKITCIS